MINNSREKTLALLLGLAVVAAAGYSLVESQILEPLDSANAQVRAARIRNANLDSEFAVVEHAQRNLKVVQKQSLPGDPSVATVMYQEWLLQRCNEAGLSSPLIVPGSPIPVEEVGYRIPFTVQSSAGMRHVGKFLDNFHKTPLLHRITYLNVSSESRSSSTRRFNANIEILALNGAPQVDRLPRPAPRKVGEQLLSELFARTDPFRRVPVTKATAPILASTKPKPDEDVNSSETPNKTDEELRFVAAITNNGQPQAWFYDSATEQGYVRNIGDTFTVDKRTVSVGSIPGNAVQLNVGTKSVTVQLGQRLNEAIGG